MRGCKQNKPEEQITSLSMLNYGKTASKVLPYAGLAYNAAETLQFAGNCMLIRGKNVNFHAWEG